ncbi:beta strand repeat-containing protein, partial [Shewanella frigidimarina]|uniref:beta strand repeat-containing protein n=1 Tax=Shewanella frigidimarina TaxID=56812 RepID=UPI000AE3BD6B
ETRSIAEDSPEVTGNVIDGTSVDGPITVTGFTIAGDTTVYDADGTDITLTGVGTFSLDSDGVYTFTPAANYNGTVPVITYTMTDGSGANDSSTLTLTVDPVDTDTKNDTNTIAEDTVASGNVLSNDEADNTSVVSFTVDANGDGAQQTFTAGANSIALTGGALVLNTDGSYSFTPNANWNGSVPVVTYTTNTGDTATLAITVTPENDNFTDNDETRSIAEDSPEVTGNVIDGTSVDGPITVTGFTIAGDTTVYDADGTDITLTNVGTFSLDSDGVYTFTPAANYNGTVPVITYTMTDGSGANDTSTLTLTVDPVDTDTKNDTNTIAEDTVASGNVLSNDEADNTSVVSFTVDANGDGAQQTFTAGANSIALTGGALVLNTDGSYSFTPNANWNGSVPVVTYTTNTGDTATLAITVTPENDNFTDDNETRSIAEDSPEVTGNVIDGTSVDGPITVTGFTIAGDTTVYD